MKTFILLSLLAFTSTSFALDTDCKVEIKKKALVEYLTSSQCSTDMCMSCDEIKIVSSQGKNFVTEITCGYPSDWSEAVTYSITALNADAKSSQDTNFCTLQLKQIGKSGN